MKAARGLSPLSVTLRASRSDAKVSVREAAKLFGLTPTKYGEVERGVTSLWAALNARDAGAGPPVPDPRDD